MAKIILSEHQFRDYCRKLLNEKQSEDHLKSLLNETFQTRDFFDKDATDTEPQELPEDICEWGRKVQELGLELSRLCGKYKEDEDTYRILSEIENEFNAVCGDLNTYDIAPHWSR